MTPEDKLEQVKAIFDMRQSEDGVTVSTNAYYNLEGALIDIERQGGKVDAVSLRTLHRVAVQLGQIANILESE